MRFIAHEAHYAEHLAPVAAALGCEVSRPIRGDKLASTEVAVVASETDRQRARPARVVRFEHGIGQSYGTAHQSYAGSGGQRGVIAFPSPNEHTAARWRAAYPELPAPVVGIPRLDAWVGRYSMQRWNRPTVVVSFHWDCVVCPETGSAFEEYRKDVLLLSLRGDLDVRLHSHPRIRRRVQAFAERHGIPYVAKFNDVLLETSLYVCDNSSTLYEFAALDRPVVVLNAAAYRRDVEHGLRFWEHADVGLQVDDPSRLVATVYRALVDPIAVAERRQEVIEQVCPYLGQATGRAIDVLREVAGLGLDTVRGRTA